MSFASDIDSIVFEGRAMAESRMRTTVELQFKTSEATTDPATDSDVPVYIEAFTTKARIKSPGRQVNDAEVGGRTSASVTRELHIPASSPDPWADSRSEFGVYALVVEVDPTDDPSLLGARLTLSGAAPGSQTTARRLEVTEVVS